jgi:sterol desaturase/sphingolipid hydroxylase (fatty acid hydroxylase superfamily)
MFDVLTDFIALAQQWLHESAVQPLLYAVGLMKFNDMAFDALEWVIIGALEIVLLAIVLGLLERRYPAEAPAGRSEWRVDVLYTALRRLGVVPLVAFALLAPLVDILEAQLRLAGLSRLQLDQLWPGVTDIAWVSFALYLVVLDFVDYWMHRGQHRLRWWWALHAVHHSQRQMTFWTDDRNHLLDDLIRDGLLAGVALLIGVAPGQFIAIVLLSRLLQSLQHANLRWRFGAVGERFLVSPSFHRLHHAVDYGHDGPAHGCNFAVLFPIWDVVFGTADFRAGFVPTGIRDQVEGRDYGRGFWMQHVLALRRMLGGH